MWNSRGSENEKTERLIILLKRTGTTMVIIEEFQHFYDKTSHKIQHHVADWLKILVDRARLGLVVSGLPECTAVISQNEQLSGRFSGAIEMPRFDWTEVSHNNDFKLILGAFRDALPTYGFPDLSSENMVFRFYCATGGLIGYMVKIFKETLLKAEAEGRMSVSLGDLAIGYQDAIWQCRQRTIFNPFLVDFDPTPSPYILDLAREVGTKETQMEPQVQYANYKPAEITAAEALAK
ncbi:hypothetical protein ZMTM_24580 [Methyloradius palustris]|uniref:Transposition helper protein n=2 Tax=Methyloradius palustris TaxID=2778876 RepID=A0A8D5GG98_9PROT|nr:hypothetical protein ZMTM_24580 [Methyloradius palustris]